MKKVTVTMPKRRGAPKVPAPKKPEKILPSIGSTMGGMGRCVFSSCKCPTYQKDPLGRASYQSSAACTRCLHAKMYHKPTKRDVEEKAIEAATKQAMEEAKNVVAKNIWPCSMEDCECRKFNLPADHVDGSPISLCRCKHGEIYHRKRTPEEEAAIAAKRKRFGSRPRPLTLRPRTTTVPPAAAAAPSAAAASATTATTPAPSNASPPAPTPG